MEFVDEEDHLPSAAVISFRTAFNRSSNSPRYFARR